MPVLREAAVAVAGTVLDVEQTTDYESKKPNGARVMLHTADGFARVKYDLSQFNDYRPAMGEQVAILVRFGAWSGRSQQGETTCTLVRPLTEDDLDRMADNLRVPAKV